MIAPKFINRVLTFLIVVGATLSLSGCFDSREVELVRNGKLNSCPQATVGQVINGFMGSPKWASGKSADGQVFVNIEGDITFKDKPVRAMIQFFLDGESFSFNAFEMNGVPSANLIAIGLLDKMCASVSE